MIAANTAYDVGMTTSDAVSDAEPESEPEAAIVPWRLPWHYVMHSLKYRLRAGVLTARNGSDFIARFVGASNSLTMLPIVVFSPVLNATRLRHSCVASTSLACSCTGHGKASRIDCASMQARVSESACKTGIQALPASSAGSGRRPHILGRSHNMMLP